MVHLLGDLNHFLPFTYLVYVLCRYIHLGPGSWAVGPGSWLLARFVFVLRRYIRLGPGSWPVGPARFPPRFANPVRLFWKSGNGMLTHCSCEAEQSKSREQKARRIVCIAGMLPRATLVVRNTLIKLITALATHLS